jgi:hypothetical protein
MYYVYKVSSRLVIFIIYIKPRHDIYNYNKCLKMFDDKKYKSVYLLMNYIL